MKVSHIKD